METLIHPPFAANPPVKFNLSASTLGIVMFILSILGAIFIGLSALGLLILLWTGFFTIINVFGMLIGVGGQVMLAMGSWKMYKNDPSGKRLAIMGLAVNFLGALLGNIPYGIFTIFSAVIGTAVVYYLIIISRFPNEQRLVATGMQTPYGGQPPYGQQPPMQQPPQTPYGGGQPPMPPQNPPQQ